MTNKEGVKCRSENRSMNYKAGTLFYGKNNVAGKKIRNKSA